MRRAVSLFFFRRLAGEKGQNDDLVVDASRPLCFPYLRARYIAGSCSLVVIDLYLSTYAVIFAAPLSLASLDRSLAVQLKRLSNLPAAPAPRTSLEQRYARLDPLLGLIHLLFSQISQFSSDHLLFILRISRIFRNILRVTCISTVCLCRG